MKSPIDITYVFSFSMNDMIIWTLKLDPDELVCIGEPRLKYPEWTALDYCQCENCPFSVDEIPRCPLAELMPAYVEKFGSRVSHEQVQVEVRTMQRVYSSVTTLQDALRSLTGIYMASSGCPHLMPLRPMLLTHLPLANGRETAFKAVTMYLLAQYLRSKRGQEPDWDLVDLPSIYQDIHTVNIGFAKRLSSASTLDANVNSLIKLDLFTILVPQMIEDHMRDYESLFLPYLDQAESWSVTREAGSSD